MSAQPEAICRAPGPLGRCILEPGHDGHHWNSGGPWSPKSPRKAWGSEPMTGTIEDVHVLHDNVLQVMAKLVEEGVPWPT